MTTEKDRVAAFWNQQVSRNESTYWADYPLVRRYVNQAMTDTWWAYPTHGFKAGWAYQPLGRGLSIGCGTGLLERDLRWLRICEEVDAFDLSEAAIEKARERAVHDHLDGVTFTVADCETFDYPFDHYDAVFFSGSLHHIADPAALLDRILPSLRDGGLLYLDDYVGPSRDEWPSEDLSPAEEAYRLLPAAWRTAERVLPPFDSSDPSEMIRSSTILPAIRSRFDILWERPYWGNILFPVLCHVNGEVAAAAVESDGILERLIARERECVAEGLFTRPLFTWIVGRKPRPGGR